VYIGTFVGIMDQISHGKIVSTRRQAPHGIPDPNAHGDVAANFHDPGAEEYEA
jgi:hypothetical protein